MEDVALEVVDELRGIDRCAVEATEHVLCVARVALSPCLIVQFVYQAGAVVALVKRRSYQAYILWCAGIPCGDDLACDRCHGLFGLKAWVQQP